MRIPVLFESAHATAEREVLIDSGATDNFISKNLLHRLKIGYLPVENPIKIWNVDGTHNQDGAISHFTDLQVRTGTETKTLCFLITNLGRDEVILGYPWLTAFEPIIHWRDATLDKECQPVVISSVKPDEAHVATTMTEEEWEALNTEEGPTTFLRKTTTASELAQKALDKTPKTFEQMVPEEYRHHAQTVTSRNRSIHFSLFYPMLTFSLRLMVTHRLDSCDHLLYRLVTRYVPCLYCCRDSIVPCDLLSHVDGL